MGASCKGRAFTMPQAPGLDWWIQHTVASKLPIDG